MRSVRFRLSIRLSDVTLGLGIVLAVALAAQPAAATDEAGHVLSVSGTWTAGGKPLGVGDTLFGGTTIVGASTNAASDFIQVKLVGGLRADDPSSVFKCLASTPCARGIPIPAVATDGPLQRLEDVVFAIFTRERQAEHGSSRGVGEEQLDDGVLRLAGNRLSLGATARSVDDGTYVLILTGTLPSGATAHTRDTFVLPLTIDVKHPATSASVVWPTPKAGLYRAHLERPNDASDPLGEDALLLVVDADRYGAASATYARMAASLHPTDSNAPADADTRAFLRATLEALGQSH